MIFFHIHVSSTICKFSFILTDFNIDFCSHFIININLVILCSHQAAFLIQFYIYTICLKTLLIFLPVVWGEITWLNSLDNRWIRTLSPTSLCYPFFFCVYKKTVLLISKKFTFSPQLTTISIHLFLWILHSSYTCEKSPTILYEYVKNIIQGIGCSVSASSKFCFHVETVFAN